MRTSARVLLAQLAATAMIAAGCGDDDEPSVDATTAEEAGMTIDRWRSEANSICRRGDEEISAGAEDAFGGSAPTPAERDRFTIEVQVPAIDSQIDAIAALPAPEQEAARIEAMVAEFRRGIEEIEANPAITAQGNAAIPGLAEATAIARGLGLVDCIPG